MKHVGDTLRAMLTERGLKHKDVAEPAGISTSNFSQILNKDTVDCKVLEDICKSMRISPLTFYDYTGSDSDPIIAMQKEIDLLRELLAEKERMIRVLMGVNPVRPAGQKSDK